MSTDQNDVETLREALKNERVRREAAEAALGHIRELGGVGTSAQIARRYFEGLSPPGAAPTLAEEALAPACPTCHKPGILMPSGQLDCPEGHGFFGGEADE
jgi:hypothetical protein